MAALWTLAVTLGLLGWWVIVGLGGPWLALALAFLGVLGILTLGNAIAFGRWRPW